MNEHLIAVDANTPLSEVMRILQAEDVPFVLVEEKTGPTPVLLGIIDAENIAEYLLIKKAQEALVSSVSP
jgi:CBS domain-containing protein